jgi:hypothetical protein
MAALNLFDRHIVKMTLALSLFLNCFVSLKVYAAPHPGMGSSLLVAPERGLFWRRKGFELKTGGSGWELAAPQQETATVRYLKPGSASGSLSVQMETLKAELSLENYAKRWMRDYFNYGFDVLGTQTFVQKGAKGLVVDLFHKKSDQQLRQILFLKNKNIVILTCRDDRKKFTQTLQGCNQISKTFEWLPNPTRPATF